MKDVGCRIPYINDSFHHIKVFDISFVMLAVVQNSSDLVIRVSPFFQSGCTDLP